MAKPTPLENYLTGTNEWVTPTKMFLYEISIDRIYPSRMESVRTRYICSPVPLHFKRNYKVQKKKEYIRTVTISWIGAPKKYIIDNNLQKYGCK